VPGLLRWTLLLSLLGHSMGVAALKLLPVSEQASTSARLTELLRLPPPAAPEPLPSPTPAREERFVRASRPAAPPPPDTELQSERDQAASRPRRSPTVSPAGPSRPAQQRGDAPGGHRTIEESPGSLHTRRGGPDGTPAALSRGARGGGGQLGHRGRQAPSEQAGRTTGGGARRGDRAPHPSDARFAGRALPRLAPDSPWWRPTVARLQVSAGPARAMAHGPVAPAPAEGLAPAPVEAPQAPRAAEVPEETTDTAPASPRPTPGAERHVVAAPMGDPIEELREALGFGVLDRGELAPRPRAPGLDHAAGASSSAPSAPFDLPADLISEVDARGTPLGRWVAAAGRRIEERWRGLDLSAHDRARGIQGDVTVCYRVLPSGRVLDVHVRRSSGLAGLDTMAVAAVPDRLPRPPRDHGGDGLVHCVTLRYSNPQVSMGLPL
jgi:TonB family protein